MKRLGCGWMMGALIGTLFGLPAARAQVRVVDAPPPDGVAGQYLGNRAPLTPSRLIKLPIGSITPRGWLRKQLELEADGMAGHLEQISPFLVFEGNAWTSPNGVGKNGWEEVPYWLRGFGDLGYVLKDRQIVADARRWIDAVLATQQPDGWFGPADLRHSEKGKPDLWPQMPMLDALSTLR